MDANELYKKNQQIRLEIMALRERTIELEDLIKENEKKMWILCKHEWKYDTSCGQNDNLRYYCRHCKLWKHTYMYK